MNERVDIDTNFKKTLAPSVGHGSVWRTPLIAVTLMILTVFALYWQTVWSMISIWERSETFTHGYLILPISLFLVWQRRHELARLMPEPELRGLFLLPLLGVVWLFAHYAGILVIEQLAMVAMVPAVVLTMLGWRVAWALLFPLFFLFFSVPMGEELIPPLMDVTADFTVAALQLTGIPVYREGTFFEIPSGHWSVVEGCSGVRYLIASVTLGCLYAYLTYRSPLRRTVFVILSIVVPIVANGLRAYMIVMIAHLSDMRLALGVDHFIYGWVFFGLVMLLLFWLGSFWREDTAPADAVVMSSAAPNRSAASPWRAGAIVLVMLLLWPALGYVNTLKQIPVDVTIAMPLPRGEWQATDDVTPWRPHYLGADAALQQTYARGENRVSVDLEYYRHQRQDAELVNSQNVLVKQKDPVWRQVADRPREISINGESFRIREAKLRSERQDLLVWHWYWMDGAYTTNHYLAKLWEGKAKLLGETGDAAAIILATELGAEDRDAVAVLTDFINTMEPSLRASLETVADE